MRKNDESDLRDERLVLEEQQTMLIQALLNADAIPQGVDFLKAKESGRALKHKRKRSVEKGSLGVIAELGEVKFTELYNKFVQKHPGSHPDGPCADTEAFLRSIGRYPRTFWGLKIPVSKIASVLIFILKLAI